MRVWIFKAIYMPISLVIAFICIGIIGLIFKEIGWDVPFRWLCLIGMLALVADKVVNP